MTTTIIGIGLIGGSFALSLRDHKLTDRIIGVDDSEKNRETALKLGLVDECLPFDEAVAQADLVVIAIPVNAIPAVAVKVLNKLKPGAVAIDMGSIKQELCEMISMHKNRSQFVAVHPMWGTENSGPAAAVHHGFAGRVVVYCDSEKSDPEALKKVEEIFATIGMIPKFMNAEEHDMHAAYVSHISHITSFALALTVMEKEREEEHIFDLAGGGFESTVRLARSSASMWVPILIQNKYNVLDVLREHIHQLQVFRKMIEKDDREGLSAMMAKANKIGSIIDFKS